MGETESINPRQGYVGGGCGGGECYVVRRVPTPFGYRLRTIDVCEY
jgi:hypothetical protein